MDLDPHGVVPSPRLRLRRMRFDRLGAHDDLNDDVAADGKYSGKPLRAGPCTASRGPGGLIGSRGPARCGTSPYDRLIQYGLAEYIATPMQSRVIYCKVRPIHMAANIE
jgi:hypothetical protein